MCRFVETIRLQNHELCNIALHQLRYENTARRFFDSGYALEDIAKVVSQFSERSGVNKIRIVYDESGVVFTSCEPYTMKNIKTLRLVECNDIDYTYKYADRSELDKAMTMRGNCDNVVIVRNGLLTDTSYTNIALYDGKHWLTPAHPLLRGTALMRLLDEEKLVSADIKADDVRKFSRLAMFNAMIDFGEMVLPVENVSWD